MCLLLYPFPLQCGMDWQMYQPCHWFYSIHFYIPFNNYFYRLWYDFKYTCYGLSYFISSIFFSILPSCLSLFYPVVFWYSLQGDSSHCTFWKFQTASWNFPLHWNRLFSGQYSMDNLDSPAHAILHRTNIYFFLHIYHGMRWVSFRFLHFCQKTGRLHGALPGIYWSDGQRLLRSAAGCISSK